jgi:hypothetical protein
MKRPLLGLAAVLALSCGGGTSRQYNNNDLVLAVSHAARDACSCLFVMELDDASCQAWVRASPDVTKLIVDREAKTVTATSLVLWGAKARYVNERFGCVLE